LYELGLQARNLHVLLATGLEFAPDFTSLFAAETAELREVGYDAIDGDIVRDLPPRVGRVKLVYMYADIEIRLGADRMQRNPIRFKRVVVHTSSLAPSKNPRAYAAPVRAASL
jgi:hypothetical protein